MHSERSNVSDPLEKYVKNVQALIVLLKMSKFLQRFIKNSSKLLTGLYNFEMKTSVQILSTLI